MCRTEKARQKYACRNALKREKQCWTITTDHASKRKKEIQEFQVISSENKKRKSKLSKQWEQKETKLKWFWI